MNCPHTRLFGFLLLLSSCLIGLADESTDSLLSLTDKSISINAPKEAKIEATATGGIRVTYTNATNLENAPVLDITKQFDPPREATEITFQWQAEDQAILVHVWNADEKVAYRHYPPASDYSILTRDLRYKDDLGIFEGKIRRIMVGVTLQQSAGEHVVEFENLKLEP